jgi:hypothetical protein
VVNALKPRKSALLRGFSAQLLPRVPERHETPLANKHVVCKFIKRLAHRGTGTSDFTWMGKCMGVGQAAHSKQQTRKAVGQ